MGKLFGVILTIIALASAYPIVTHMYVQPVDISTHGHAIDEQLADTMAEAGLSFVLAQLLLAFCVWRFSNRKDGVQGLPLAWGGARLMVAAAFILVGTEVLALGVLGQKAWAEVYFTAPKPDALAGPGAGWPICILFPISRTGREVWPSSSRQNR